MNKKIISRMLILISLIIILFVIYTITRIYAVFYTEAQGDMQKKISNWTIFVNNTNISEGQVENFTIDELNFKTNEHVKEGKLAPNTSGSFNITIDPSNTEVAIRYNITINKENLLNSAAQLISIKEIEQNNNLIETEKNVFTGIITLKDIQDGKKNIIETTIQWNDTGESDEKDTEIGIIKNPKIEIPITVDVSQYLGEEIIPYE